MPVAVVVHDFIASANYPARARGVRSGALAHDALRQCPELTLIDVPRAEVEEVGDALFDIFRNSARVVEPGSMEEAFLDVGASDWAGAVDAGHALRRRVARELGIPISVGVGSTKLMARLASRRAKPDGLAVIDSGEEAALRSTLPLRDVWGIGATTLQRLGRIGVLRLGDVDGIPRNELQHVCGTAMARRLWRIRAGTDDALLRPVEQRTAPTAEGSTAGYARPDRTPIELAQGCVERLCHRAERAGLAGTGITLILRPETGGSSSGAFPWCVPPAPSAGPFRTGACGLERAVARSVRNFAPSFGPRTMRSSQSNENRRVHHRAGRVSTRSTEGAAATAGTGLPRAGCTAS